MRRAAHVLYAPARVKTHTPDTAGRVHAQTLSRAEKNSSGKLARNLFQLAYTQIVQKTNTLFSSWHFQVTPSHPNVDTVPAIRRVSQERLDL